MAFHFGYLGKSSLELKTLQSKLVTDKRSCNDLAKFQAILMECPCWSVSVRRVSV